jgi:hypothetical protein
MVTRGTRRVAVGRGESKGDELRELGRDAHCSAVRDDKVSNLALAAATTPGGVCVEAGPRLVDGREDLSSGRTVFSSLSPGMQPHLLQKVGEGSGGGLEPVLLVGREDQDGDAGVRTRGAVALPRNPKRPAVGVADGRVLSACLAKEENVGWVRRDTMSFIDGLCLIDRDLMD